MTVAVATPPRPPAPSTPCPCWRGRARLRSKNLTQLLTVRGTPSVQIRPRAFSHMTLPTDIDHPRDLIYDDRVRDLLVDAIRAARARLFGHSRPDDAVQLVADATRDELVTALAQLGYTPNWLLSYHYEGEDANLVRFYHDGDLELPFRQVHVRLFIDEFPDGEIGIAAHEEASALTHRDAHLDEATFRRERGVEMVREELAMFDVDVAAAPADNDES